MAIILGIESTCDETAAAVVVGGRDVKSSVIATQFDLHARFGGVVPEIASRAHIENILPVMRQALSIANVTLEDLDAIAVAHRPGLVGSLLVGVTAAKTLAWALGRPLIGVDHVQAHLYSVLLDNEQVPPFPAVGLVVSGGHTALYDMQDFHSLRCIGSTIDDAVGEAYDKVAAILGLSFPGGPLLDRLAQGGDAKAVRFPRTMLDRQSLDFSFSGLKTSVLYHVRGKNGRERTHESMSATQIADVAASFQAACIDVIRDKLARALSHTEARSIIVGGGVSANRGLRAALGSLGIPVFFPLPPYCTDNAAMSAGLAHLALMAGQTSPLDLDVVTSSAITREN